MTYSYDLLLFANITLVTISVHVLLWICLHEKFETEEYLSLGVLHIKKNIQDYSFGDCKITMMACIEELREKIISKGCWLFPKFEELLVQQV